MIFMRGDRGGGEKAIAFYLWESIALVECARGRLSQVKGLGSRSLVIWTEGRSLVVGLWMGAIACAIGV